MSISFVYFSKVMCQFLFTCFKVRTSKISDKTDKLLLNYSNLFRGPLFIRTQHSSESSSHARIWRNEDDNWCACPAHRHQLHQTCRIFAPRVELAYSEWVRLDYCNALVARSECSRTSLSECQASVDDSAANDNEQHHEWWRWWWRRRRRCRMYKTGAFIGAFHCSASVTISLFAPAQNRQTDLNWVFNLLTSKILWQYA